MRRDALRMLESHLQRFCQAVLAVLWLSRAGTALPSDDIVGVYQYEGPVAATLEVRHEAGQYVVRLEGGGSSAEGPATAADCVVEARGDLDGVVLRARFGPVETDTFSYGAAQAERSEDGADRLRARCGAGHRGRHAGLLRPRCRVLGPLPRGRNPVSPHGVSADRAGGRRASATNTATSAGLCQVHRFVNPGCQIGGLANQRPLPGGPRRLDRRPS